MLFFSLQKQFLAGVVLRCIHALTPSDKPIISPACCIVYSHSIKITFCSLDFQSHSNNLALIYSKQKAMPPAQSIYNIN